VYLKTPLKAHLIFKIPKSVEVPLPSSDAGISKNYCTTNSGSPKVELRFCP
jgi:hypothetical protein